MESLTLQQVLLTAVAAGVTGVLGWVFGGKSTAREADARALKTLSDAYGDQIGRLESEVRGVRARVTQLERREISLVALLQKNGIEIPPEIFAISNEA